MTLIQRLELIPTVNWPEHPVETKIVQLEIEGVPCIRFPSPKMLEEFGLDDIYHHEIVWETLKDEFGIEFATFQKGRSNLPYPVGERYKIVGAGFGEVVPEKKMAIFYGDSRGYEMGINADHLDAIRRMQPDWKIFMRQ